MGSKQPIPPPEKEITTVLQNAYRHKDALQKAWSEFIDSPESYWFEQSGFVELKKEPKTDTWNFIQLVSVRSDGVLMGYFSAEIWQKGHAVKGLCMARFTDDMEAFIGDAELAFRSLFEKYEFRVVRWTCIIGAPAEKLYDRIIELTGGRIVGIQCDSAMTIDGQLHNRKLYEVHSSEYKSK